MRITGVLSKVVSVVLGGSHHGLQLLDVLDAVFDDIHFGHPLCPGRSWDMGLEMLVAVIDRLDPGPLPGVPPGHGHWHRGWDGVAMDRVIDHTRLELPGHAAQGQGLDVFVARPHSASLRHVSRLHHPGANHQLRLSWLSLSPAPALLSVSSAGARPCYRRLAARSPGRALHDLPGLCMAGAGGRESRDCLFVLKTMTQSPLYCRVITLTDLASDVKVN